MRSDFGEPLNLGTEEVMTINELARTVIDVSRKEGLTLRHVAGPEGVRGRNSDNRKLRTVLGWEPTTCVREGLQPTYQWISERVTNDVLSGHESANRRARASISGGSRIRRRDAQPSVR